MIARAHCIPAVGTAAIVLGLGLAWSGPAAAANAGANASIPPLPRADYAVRSVCKTPTRERAGCMALQLVARTAEAQAHRHPIGLARALAPASAPSAAAGNFGLRPQDLHSAYRLPTSPPNTQTIALVDAYNDLTAAEDLAGFEQEFGLKGCTGEGCFEKVNQDGETTNLPFPQSATALTEAQTLCNAREKGETRIHREEREAACAEVAEADSWSVEISLDIETARAICQSCHVVLVEANSSSYTNLEAAEETAARIGANEISNSWGGPECIVEHECVADSPAFNHPGVVVTAAAGDEGFLNWLEEPSLPYADFPASTPQVVAVGGTRLELGPNGEWAGETVWNDGGESGGVKDEVGATGGGCSTRFAAPSWQQDVGDWAAVGCGEERAVSDVSADADPYSGVAVLDSNPDCETSIKEGKSVRTVHWCTIGGTSLATPLIASTFALAGGANGVEYPASTLYEEDARFQGVLHDVTTGSSGECLLPFDEATGVSGCTTKEEAASCDSHAICTARSGFDGPTGLGTPDGIGAFMPPIHMPFAVTEKASEVEHTTATLNATVNPGGREVTECRFEYGTTTPLEASVPSMPCSPSPGAGTSAVEVSAQLAELTPGTKYYFRVVAQNSLGRGVGKERAFTTLANGNPPAVAGETASHVTESDATLEAQVDPEGLQTEYEVVLSYPCPAPMQCTSEAVVATGSLPASTSAEPVSVDLAHSERARGDRARHHLQLPGDRDQRSGPANRRSPVCVRDAARGDARRAAAGIADGSDARPGRSRAVLGPARAGRLGIADAQTLARPDREAREHVPDGEPRGRADREGELPGGRDELRGDRDVEDAERRLERAASERQTGDDPHARDVRLPGGGRKGDHRQAPPLDARRARCSPARACCTPVRACSPATSRVRRTRR